MVYKKPKKNREKKLKILEVCYTSLANITKKVQEKRDKHAPLLQRLIDKKKKTQGGWSMAGSATLSRQGECPLAAILRTR